MITRDKILEAVKNMLAEFSIDDLCQKQSSFKVVFHFSVPCVGI